MRMTALSLVLLCGAASVAVAQTDQKPPKLSHECRQQIMTACPPTGDYKAMHACMKQNKAKLSDSCQAEIAARHAAMHARREAEPSATPLAKPQ